MCCLTAHRCPRTPSSEVPCSGTTRLLPQCPDAPGQQHTPTHAPRQHSSRNQLTNPPIRQHLHLTRRPPHYGARDVCTLGRNTPERPDSRQSTSTKWYNTQVAPTSLHPSILGAQPPQHLGPREVPAPAPAPATHLEMEGRHTPRCLAQGRDASGPCFCGDPTTPDEISWSNRIAAHQRQPGAHRPSGQCKRHLPTARKEQAGCDVNDKQLCWKNLQGRHNTGHCTSQCHSVCIQLCDISSNEVPKDRSGARAHKAHSTQVHRVPQTPQPLTEKHNQPHAPLVGSTHSTANHWAHGGSAAWRTESPLVEKDRPWLCCAPKPVMLTT